MRILLILLLLLVPIVSAEYLVVTLDITSASVTIEDIELAFTASMRSSEGEGEQVTIEVIDDAWRSVSRARITASTIEIVDTAQGSQEARKDRVRSTAIVPIDDRARLLVVQSGNAGRIFDLWSASCGSEPLCVNCARVYPHWCDRARTTKSTFDPTIVAAVALNVIVLSAIAVLLLARKRA